MTEYQKELTKLNPEQIKAVKTIDGPVMVVAGPGTGKTQVLALRIAEILTKTQLNPSNILALTFTEAGVTALRDRLTKFIGAASYNVAINTFHGFAKSVVDSMAFLFSQTDTLEQIDEHEKYTILGEIIVKNHNLAELRPTKSPHFHTKEIVRKISDLKREAIKPTKLLEVAKIFEDRIVDEKSKTKIAKLTRDGKIFKELSEIYEKYQEHLAKHGLYDYDDVILMAISAFRDNPNLKAFYQEKYQYILVDEYQDTNNSQNLLIETLADFFETPNLFVVGDDKQAIYRFQGASVANMLFFKNKYPLLSIFPLRQNYRSTADVIEAAGSLIRNNVRQLKTIMPDVVTDLTAVKSEKVPVVVVKARTKQEELAWLVGEIKSVGEASVAVLCRTNAEVRAMRKFLLSAGVAVSGSDKINLLDSPRIFSLVELLRALCKTTDYPLLQSLPLINKMSLLELAKIRRKNYEEKMSVLEAIKDMPIAETIEKLNILTGQKTATEFVECVLSQTDFIAQIKNSTPNYLSELAAFSRLVRQFNLRTPGATIDKFIEFLDKTKGDNLEIEAPLALAENAGVLVSTVHGVKGMEFDSIFMVNLTMKSWGKTTNRDTIKLPSELIGVNEFDDDPLEDERRLFYVGLTRAKKNLFLSYTGFDEDDKEVSPSQFLLELGAVKNKKANIAKKKIEEIITLSLISPAQKTLDRQTLNFINEKITTLPLSFTSLHDFEQCPKRYLLKDVFSFPEPSASPLILGNAVHKTLDYFYSHQKVKKQILSKNDFIEQFSRFFDKEAVNLSEKEPLKNRGVETLSAYYEILVKAKMAIYTEYNLKSHNIKLGDIWLTGKFDKVELIDSLTKQVRIIDYKTGTVAKTRGFIEGTTKDSDGAIKKQLVFYAILAKRSKRFNYDVKEFAIRFIDDELKFKEEVFVITDAEIKELEEYIQEKYKEILSLKNFTHTADKYDLGCELCKLL